MKKLVVCPSIFLCLFGVSQQVLCAQELPPVGSQDQATPKVAQEAPQQMVMRDSASTETLHIPVGHSLILKGVGALKRVYIGNPAVLQSFTAGPSEIVLTAKTTGVSDLVLWDNRCVMHRRDGFDGSQRRVMHRTQMVGERPISASASRALETSH